MKTKWFLAVVFPILLTSCLPSALAGDSWLPNLNPFGGSDDKAKTSSYKSSASSGDDESSWRLSDERPKGGLSSSRSSSEPSTWSKFSTGTANTFRKSTSYLTPWKQAKAPPPKPSGSRGIRTSAKSASQKQASSSTWYNPTTWFAGETKPTSKKNDTIPGFLGQSRPSY